MQDFWQDEPILKQELTLVGDTIREAVESSHGFIRPILLSHVHPGGKMLRPALVLLCAKLGKEFPKQDAIRVASVMEMIHLASLVHDDIIDTAKKRRGMATIFAQVGAKQAVLAGDYLLAKALALISGKEREMESIVVSNALSRLCESELEQDAGQGNYFISKQTYYKRIGGKTASLFALSCYAGASTAKLTAIERMVCHRIGYAMGMAFQIQDDILDYIGSDKELGKLTGNDLKCGIPTLPLLLALEDKKKEAVRELKMLLTTKNRIMNATSVRKAVFQVIALGGVQKADSIAESYRMRALRDIESLQNQEVAKQLARLFKKLAVRSA